MVIRKGANVIRYEGRNRETVNLLRAIQFDGPEWTPCHVGLMPATWMKHREALEDLVLAHPRLWPGARKGQTDFDAVWGPLYEAGRHTDAWGCVWENIQRGLDSAVVKHPLADWAAMETWRPPDPLKDDLFGPRPTPADLKRRMDEAKARGGLAIGDGLPHGCMYMLLYYLRGFDNLMIDMATDEPRLQRLIAIVEHYNSVVIRQWLEAGAERIGIADDLGMQRSVPMGPALWRKFIKPPYDRMLRPARERDVPVYLHSDGHILEIIPDLIEVGIRILNPQVRANGLEGLKRIARGKVAIHLDLDRQLFPFATPAQIEDHIGEACEMLSTKEGGLMLYAEIEPDVSLETVEVICRTLEKLCRPPMPARR